MKKLRLFGLAVVAACALSVVAAASASAALPEALFSGSSASFEGTSGSGTLETTKGTKIVCTSGSNAGTITGAKTGTASLVFKGCKSSGFNCKTTGAGTGEIITSGSTLLVYDGLSPAGVAQLLAVNETTVECTALVKIKVKGNILLGVSPLNESVSTLALTVTQEKGKPTHTTYWNNETGAEEKAQLLSSINGGAFEESGDTSEGNSINTSTAVEVMA